MINKTYIELINKEIDGVIAPHEKELLHKYLEQTPEAEKLYNELLETEESLDKLYEPDPPIYLQNRILNSIDYNRYSQKNKRTKAFSFGSIFPGSRRGLIVSFSMGLAAGIIMITLLFSNPELISTYDEKDIYGTMGLADTRSIENIEINTKEVSGSIGIIKGADLYGDHPDDQKSNHFGFDINLNSGNNYTLQILINSSQLEFDKFTSTDIGKIRLEKGKGMVSINSSGNQHSMLVLSAGNIKPEALIVKIVSDEKLIFERNIQLKNNPL